VRMEHRVALCSMTRVYASLFFTRSRTDAWLTNDHRKFATLTHTSLMGIAVSHRHSQQQPYSKQHQQHGSRLRDAAEFLPQRKFSSHSRLMSAIKHEASLESKLSSDAVVCWLADYIGTKLCRYNWHSAGSVCWPFPILKYKYIFQIKYTKAIVPNSTRKLL